MARTAISVQDLDRSGLVPTMTTANKTDGNKFVNDGKTIIYVYAHSTAPTITIQTPGSVDGLAIADRTVSVTASDRKFIGPFPPSQYNQGDDEVYIDVDNQCQVAILRV